MTYYAENLLPNYRVTEKCCYNCKNYDEGWEGEGDCKIMREKMEIENYENDIHVSARTSDYNLCDLWFKKEDKQENG